jgi:signal transduction histidine kinase
MGGPLVAACAKQVSENPPVSSRRPRKSRSRSRGSYSSHFGSLSIAFCGRFITSLRESKIRADEALPFLTALLLAPLAVLHAADAPQPLALILGDPTQLHQVLLNLCVNARDAMPNGGSLTISAENLTLDAHYADLNFEAKPGPYVFLQVEDSGTGMPPEVIKKSSIRFSGSGLF